MVTLCDQDDSDIALELAEGERVDSAVLMSRVLRSFLLAAACWYLSGFTNVRAAQVTIGVIGDYGSAYAGGASFSNEQAVANLIKSWNPDFIITTGDNNYPNGEAA